jgi:hypothetical protein
VSGHTADLPRSTRERSRSRFHVGLVLAGLTLLAGCSNHWGFGITELPAERGWLPLPIGSWVLNDGLSAQAMSFCPRERCDKAGFAALLRFDGKEAQAMERALSADTTSLARGFAKPSAAAIAKAKKAKTGLGPPKSTTTVTRFTEADARGLLVEIRAHDASAKAAFAAILFSPEAGRLALAFAAAGDAETARRDAAAAWRSR